MMNHALSMLCTPYPDEFFGGTILRFHERYGTGNLRQTLRAQLRLGRGGITGIPTALNDLIDRIPLGPTDINSLLENHTTWPIYRPFLTRRGEERAWERITLRAGGGLQLTLGDAASRLAIGLSLQACPRCAANDFEQVGRPYLHVDHQIPGIRACPRHAVILKRIRSAFSPAYDPFAKIHGGVSASAPTAEFELASLASALRAARLPRLGTEAIAQAYVARLTILGLLTRRGRVRYRYLATLFEQRFSRELHERLGASQTDLCHWVHSLLFRPDRNHHPIKHLVFIGAVFGTIRKFEEALRQGEFQFYSENHRTKHRDIAAEIARELSKHPISISRVAQQLGISVNTCLTHSARQGFTVHTRPKQLTPRTVAAIKRLAAVGKPIGDISTHTHMSVSTVYRVLRGSLETERQRRNTKEVAALVQHRAIWKKHACGSRYVGINAIRKRAPATYMWLYRHDRNWLRAHSPKPTT